ncbi:hypothetical protein Scep_003831 [Stephania cephalantha]|uniref:Uncharacterized protein n=1 Tax=Stephania cephalantha TaxID=152367 RepID=A0AAP0KR93_9MAGN
MVSTCGAVGSLTTLKVHEYDWVQVDLDVGNAAVWGELEGWELGSTIGFGLALVALWVGDIDYWTSSLSVKNLQANSWTSSFSQGGREFALELSSSTYPSIALLAPFTASLPMPCRLASRAATAAAASPRRAAAPPRANAAACLRHCACRPFPPSALR